MELQVNNDNVADMDCVIVEPFLIEDLWPKIKEFFENYPANDFDTYGAEETRQECLEGNWQLWLIMRNEEIIGSFCTNLVEQSGRIVVNIFSVVGEQARSWTSVLDRKVGEFAKQNGANYIFAAMRKGFLRYAPQYQEIGTMYCRKV